jgi:hypothetical protein
LQGGDGWIIGAWMRAACFELIDRPDLLELFDWSEV